MLLYKTHRIFPKLATISGVQRKLFPCVLRGGGLYLQSPPSIRLCMDGTSTNLRELLGLSYSSWHHRLLDSTRHHPTLARVNVTCELHISKCYCYTRIQQRLPALTYSSFITWCTNPLQTLLNPMSCRTLQFSMDKHKPVTEIRLALDSRRPRTELAPLKTFVRRQLRRNL